MKFSLILICLFLWGIGHAGMANAQEPTDPKVARVQNLVDTLNDDIRELRRLSASLEASSKTDHDFVNYRLDERAFNLLSDFDQLVAQLPELPADTPHKQDITTRLVELSDGVADAIFDRIDEVKQRITDVNNALDSLSGGKQVSAQAYIQNMEDIRTSYYRAMVAHIESREVLGLPSEQIRQRLDPRLYLYVETLAGRIEYSAAAIKKIRTRLSADKNDADVKAAIIDLETKHSIHVNRLQVMIPVLDRLKLDSAEYKTVMLQQSNDISVSFFSVKSLLAVANSGWTALKTSLEKNAADIIFRLFLFILILFAFRVLSRLTRRLVRAASDRSSLDLSELLKNILVSTSGGLVMGIGVLMALSQVGISLAPMLAGLGVAGFIVGFALQDTLGNFAAGAMILIYRPFDVNDFVEVTGASGLVKKMNLVSTTITTFDNQTLVVPNSKIWGDVIKNVTAQTQRRVDLEFGIGYDDDIELAERVLKDIIENHDKILDDPKPNIRLHTLGDSSVNFIVRPWARTEDYWEVYWDITREVKLRFDREGISIPFPQRDVHLYSESPAKDQ